MAALAIHDKKAPDERFEEFLPLLVKHAADDRNFVKKAVNWALRQIGKRNVRLNSLAFEQRRTSGGSTPKRPGGSLRMPCGN